MHHQSSCKLIPAWKEFTSLLQLVFMQLPISTHCKCGFSLSPPWQTVQSPARWEASDHYSPWKTSRCRWSSSGCTQRICRWHPTVHIHQAATRARPSVVAAAVARPSCVVLPDWKTCFPESRSGRMTEIRKTTAPRRTGPQGSREAAAGRTAISGTPPEVAAGPCMVRLRWWGRRRVSSPAPTETVHPCLSSSASWFRYLFAQKHSEGIKGRKGRKNRL